MNEEDEQFRDFQLALERARYGFYKDSIPHLYIFFDGLYREKVILLQRFKDKRTAIKSQSDFIIDWHNKFSKYIKKEDKRLLNKIVKEIEHDELKYITVETDDVAQKFAARYRICRRFYENISKKRGYRNYGFMKR